MVHQQGLEEASRRWVTGIPATVRTIAELVSQKLFHGHCHVLPTHPSIRTESGVPLCSCLRVATPRRLMSGESISGRGKPVSCIPSWLFFWAQMLGPSFGYHLFIRMLCCPWSLPLFRLDADPLEAMS